MNPDSPLGQTLIRRVVSVGRLQDLPDGQTGKAQHVTAFLLAIRQNIGEDDTDSSMSDIVLDVGSTVDTAYDGLNAPNCPGGNSTAWLYSTTRCPAWTAWSSADA